MERRQHLVVGTDFSGCAERALEAALALAQATEASITLVHVCELGGTDLNDRHSAECEEALSRIVTRYRVTWSDVVGVLRSGHPWTKLDNVAVEVGACLIVIGRQGSGRDRGAALGSVAHQLLRTANRPVLLVPCDFDRLDAEADEGDPGHQPNPDNPHSRNPSTTRNQP